MKIQKILGSLLVLAMGPAFSQPANSLSEAEKAQGWVLLFDGKSLNGWHAKNQAATSRSWLVNDSAIYRGPDSKDHLYSPVAAQDFEFSGQFKDSAGSRFREGGLGERAWGW